MVREDIKMIIEAERKSADERMAKMEEEYRGALMALHAEHLKYQKKRDAMDWIWTGTFTVVAILFVVFVAVLP